MPKNLMKFVLFVFALLIFAGCTSENADSLVETASADTMEDEGSAKKPQDSLQDMLVHYINVGQADATLLEFSDEEDSYTMLIDTGNWNATEVVDYLHAENISAIDIITITHPHADHIGQLDKIINTFDVSEVWMNGEISNAEVFERALAAIEDHDIDYYEPTIGDLFDIGPVAVKILHPDSLSGGTNDNSIAIRLQYGDISFLFTGDGELQAERSMLSRGENVQADILHVGHHGSKTSTSEEFLTAVNPAIAIYSAGIDNKYGHPDQEVVDRINSHGALLYGTDTHGTILVETDGVTYTVQTHKDGTISRTPVDIEEIEEIIPIADGSCVDLNYASEEEIQNIIHIGVERAKSVIEQRPFNSIDELTKIKGIGPARIDDIKAQGVACTGG